MFAPSPTLTVTVESGADDGGDEIHLHAGGQGFWVARMMRALGMDVTLCCALGGESGRVLRTLVEGEGIEVDDVVAGGENGSYLHDRRSGERVELATSRTDALSRHALDDLYGAALTAGLLADVTVLTGADEHVLPAETYRRLAVDLGNNGRLVIADLSGDQLVAAARGGVDVVKASEDDLRRDGLLVGDDDHALLATIAGLAELGARVPVVTRAKRPLVALVGGEYLEATTPEIEAVDHRGAGDSLTGAMAATMAAGADTQRALRIGAAAGATNVTRRGLATGARAHIERMAELVELRGFLLEATHGAPCTDHQR